uniref:Uncharacterized protein n=1 Tax=Anguilla anguilla TaxID=7936 RepID=A0A0E9UIC1_ANGAN
MNCFVFLFSRFLTQTSVYFL